MVIRKYQSSDCRQLTDLFYQTVHTINARDYSKEQLDAWADGNIDLAEWDQSFLSHHTLVCFIHDLIVGFGDMDETGYLDRLFVHKDYQGQGVASVICDELEKSVKVNKIMTHASITAKPFFEKRGYKTVKKQQVMKNGVFFVNYVMEKML